MPGKTNRLYMMGDFETTVYDDQKSTEVWASAVVPFYSENVRIFHSIDETFEYLESLKRDIVIYYHNLKFDGAFWLSYLMLDLCYKQAINGDPDEDLDAVRFKKQNELTSGTFRYVISDSGQWYKIEIKTKSNIIEIRDSLKLLPYSVKEIGKSFGTKHKKLDMEYKGFRYAGCNITDEEQKYIANDVLVVKEALEIMFANGMDKLTIGACCLSEYRQMLGKYYLYLYPDLYQIKIDKNVYGTDTAGEYIRKSYRGGWCYLVKGKEMKKHYNGTTADVNSLYPSMMSSESGNRYPYGKPTFWHGDFIPVEAKESDKYYFLRIRTQFYIKPNHLPFIQNKSSWMYSATECLETSDIYDEETGKYWDHYIDDFNGGKVTPATMTMTLTMTDYKLLRDQYELVNFEILDGCYFNARMGLFDKYINKWKKIKIESTGARRSQAKLALNSLYGKMASSKDSSFKVAYLDPEDLTVGYYSVVAAEKKPGYIACGSAITSYARNFTIRAAQANYYGKDKPGFIYADTDSIHCDIPPEEIKGIKVDPVNFCCWKLESCWNVGWFVRQKTYIEHVTHENLKPIDKPYYNVKCAGMAERCKELFIETVERTGDIKPKNEAEERFLKRDRTLEDFKVGLTVPGRLIPKRIMGGVVLVDGFYKMRERI